MTTKGSEFTSSCPWTQSSGYTQLIASWSGDTVVRAKKRVNALTPCDLHNFNGGWINVYANTTGGEVYLGQVQADLNTIDFDYVPDGATVTLYAFPDNQKQCTFDYFEGSAPGGPTSLTIEASGALPIVFFRCP